MSVCLSVRPSVLYTFLNCWTDFDEMFRACMSGSRNDFDSQLDPVSPTLKQGF